MNTTPFPHVTAVAQTPITRQSNFISAPLRRRFAASWILPLLLCMLPAAVQAQDYEYTSDTFTITITRYIGGGGDVAIPDTIDGLPVASIGEAAFSGLTSLTSVTIPDSVISIGVGAFNMCGNLTGVTIGNSVTSIGNGAFTACGKLTSVTIPNSVTSIGISTFQVCTGLTSVVIGNGVTSIGFRTFRQCSSLTSVTIGNSVTSIEREAFNQCSILPTVTIPSSVTSIGLSAFQSCSGLTGVYFNGNAPTIDSSLFNLSINVIVYYYLGTTGWPIPPVLFGGRPMVGLNPPNPPPTVTTGTASGITATDATLNGTVNPNGLASTARFEYGLTDAYGSTADVTLSPDNGTIPQAVSAGISGLQPLQTYHYRLTATNSSGTSPGADMTFETYHVLTVNALHGTVPGAGQYAPNTTVELTATASPGYVFTDWSGDATGTDNPLAVLMDASKTITANFAPDTRDSDDDGLNNYDEIVTYGTNPTLPDTDVDGLTDGQEVNTYGSSPFKSDTDDDGFDDLFEVNSGFDPTLASSTPDIQSSIRTAVEFRFNAATGVSYRIEASTDLITWDIIESDIIGQSAVVTRFYSTENQPKRFFQAKRN